MAITGNELTGRIAAWNNLPVSLSFLNLAPQSGETEILVILQDDALKTTLRLVYTESIF